MAEPRFESITEKEERERARAWAYYLRGGGGDPSYFDGYAAQRISDQRYDREQDRLRDRMR